MNLNVMCNINPLSYGVVPFYFLRYLYKANVKCSLFPINNCDLSAYADQDCDFLQKFIENAKDFDPDAPTLRIYHQFAMAESVGRGKRIGWSFYELNKLKVNEVAHINSLDLFIVSSEWAKEVAINSGVKVPIEIIAPSSEIHCKKDYLNRPDGVVKFMCVGKLEVRKCHDMIIQAFSKAFGAFDSVQLDMYTHNPFNSEEENNSWAQFISRSPLSHKIKLCGPIQLHTDVLKNYGNYDCFVGLSRAEGFNLPLFEAMRSGLLCIANDNSAMEYIREDNCIYVCKNGDIPAVDNKWFFGEGEWADFQEEDIKLAFIKAKQDIEDKDSSKAEGGFLTLEDHSWKKSVRKFIKVVEKM